jgi:class 3 adenylate cyclase
MCATALTASAEEPSLPALDEAIQRLVPREFAERLLATRGQVGKERRVVTTLFSDVKGSTAMAESLDAEDVMEITDGAFGVLIEPIYRYEGTLARLMGDAVLAFFGTPIAHEDDQNCTVMPRLAPNLKCTLRYAGLTDDPNYGVIRLESSSNSEARRAI